MGEIYAGSMEKLEYCSHTLVTNQIKPNSKILEFGCGAGGVTEFLKNDLNCEVTIIEYSEKAYDQAIKFAVDGFCGDAEGLEWLEKFKGQQFDFIMFADVLEHLRRPEIVLEKSKELLKDEGLILISIPNVCNGAIMAEMHQNNFQYFQVGLLDNTHIHLFSYNSLCRMIINCGLDIIIQDAFCLPLENTEFNSALGKLTTDVLEVYRNKPMSTIYQFIFTLKKQNPQNEKINRIESRIGFTTKIYITDACDFPLHCISVPVINTSVVKFDINLNKSVNSINVLPMYGSGCILKNIRVAKDGNSSNFTTNAHIFDDNYVFLNNDDIIKIKGLSQTTVLSFIADVVFDNK